LALYQTLNQIGVNKMKKYITLLLIVVFTASILFMGISCGNGGTLAVEEEEITEEVLGEASETEVKSSVDHEVSIEDFAFNPSDLTIKVGDTVTWTNNDGAAHTVKMDTFESETMPKGDTFSFTFSDAGIYKYICGIHPSMNGKIIVE
ncbi:MAG: cupredoxin family copper-binding protein, partial [Actinobacteria bacterium]|nr:cupredoxin family copper-binding protein [Actinomycetota bacterium]